MSRNVKGTLFADYVRTLRARRNVDWARHLDRGDLVYLSERIEPDRWYPMETFERFGLAILDEIARGKLDLVRQFGRWSIDGLCAAHGNLIAPGDPSETLMRFRVLRQSFFDFEALVIDEVYDGEATAIVSYGMRPRAEEAATHQTLGFFERLLEMSGATRVDVRLGMTSWQDDRPTTILMTWEM